MPGARSDRFPETPQEGYLMRTTTLPIHPTTGLRALGWTKRGPIWPVMGGSGEGDGGTGEGNTGDQGDGTGDQGAKTNPPATPPAKAAEGNTQDVASLPDWAQKLITDTRAEAAKDRTAAKTKAAEDARQSLAQEIGKALGLVKGDEKPDPAQLTAQLAEKDASERQARVELAVFRTASKHNADPDALLDSRAFLAKLTDLDPNDNKKVGDVIAAFVKDNPRYSVGQAPAGRSGAQQFTPNGSAPAEPDSLEAAVAARYAGNG